jgi:glucose-1-phosphate cytidylyltransferase
MGFEGDRICNFHEKPESGEGWINGGFFVLNRKAIDYISDDDTSWEKEPLERLTEDGQMMGYRHYGFWSCMDTLKEKNSLEEFWASKKAPWKIWD